MFEQIIAAVLVIMFLVGLVINFWAFGFTAMLVQLHDGVRNRLDIKHGVPLYILCCLTGPFLCTLFGLKLLTAVFTGLTLVHLLLEVMGYVAVRYMGVKENV